MVRLPAQEEYPGLDWPFSQLGEQGPRLDLSVSLLRKRVLDWTGLPAQEKGPDFARANIVLLFTDLLGLYKYKFIQYLKKYKYFNL